MDDDVIVIYDEIEEEPEQFTAQNYEYMLAQTLLTREAIQEKLQDPSENSNFQFVGSATHNNSIWNNFLAVTYGGVEQNFFKCRDCNEIFDKDPQKSLADLRNHNCKAPMETQDEHQETIIHRPSRTRRSEKPKILTREQLEQIYRNPKERKFLVTRQKSNFKCFAWQFLDVVFYKGQKQPFARCRYCGMLVSYTNKNGTSSIRKHALRCPDILRAKRSIEKQRPKSLNSHNLMFRGDIKQWDDSSDESSDPESSLIPEVEIYLDDDQDEIKPETKLEKESNGILSCAQLKKMYSTNKDSKFFLFRKSKRRDIKNTFWNWLEAVYYKDIQQDCYKCVICDTFISAMDENELAVHITNHNSKNQIVKKVVVNKKEKMVETITDVRQKSYLKKNSPMAAKTEHIDSTDIEVPSETVTDTTNLVTSNLIDFIVTSAGQSLSFIEDSSFRILAQSLIRLGAKHGDRSANDLFPSIDSILKQSIPLRVRVLKTEIRELLAHEQHMSISVDLVKDDSPQSNAVSYLTVKIHIITKCFTSRVFVLGTYEFHDNVTHDAVQEAFSRIMKEYVETEALHKRCIVVLNESSEALVKAFDIYTCLPSVTHSLELIVNKVLQVEDPELNVSDTVVKIQELFDHITTEHNYSVSKGECLLDLLEEFYEMNKPIEKLLKETRPCQRDHSALSDIPKHTVKTILNGFQVIKLCVDTIRQNQITINGILLWKKKLIEQYSPVLYDHRLNARLKFHTLELIQTKFLIDHPIYKIALFLNPNFKNLKFLTENDRREVFSSIKEMFLNRFSDCTELGGNVESETIDKEINRYYTTKSFDYSNEDLLEFWKKMTLFPHLRILAKHILSIPGTSDGVNEEVFQRANRSLANGIGTNADFNSIIFLHSNSAEV